MGRTYVFECPKCGYAAKVAGGASRGFHFAVQTILCHDCRELHEAVIALKTSVSGLAGLSGEAQFKSTRQPAAMTAPTFHAVLNRLAPAGRKRFKWVHFEAACPVSARHRVRNWQSPDQCPKCGCFLECNAIPFRLWD